MMKVIIEHDEENSGYLGQYSTCIEHLGLNCKMLEIEEQYLPWLNQIAAYVEPNFAIERGNQDEWMDKGYLNNKNICLAYIGIKQTNGCIDEYYNMMTHTISQTHPNRFRGAVQRISCYSEEKKLSAADYIKCIRYLMDKAKELNLPLIICSDLYIVNETYRYRSLTYKIINNYARDSKVIFVIKAAVAERAKYDDDLRSAYTQILEPAVYVDDFSSETIKQALSFLDSIENNGEPQKIHKSFRQIRTLYADTFYRSINPEQEIYVLIGLGGHDESEYYENLGIRFIRLINTYSLLYARKSVFDANSEALRDVVLPQYEIPIVSYSFQQIDQINRLGPYSIVQQPLRYKGEGIYIGIIDVNGVDYTNDTLRTNDGRSRIACIWDQIQADLGTYYLNEQINVALESENPIAVVPITDTMGISTSILGIAGGEIEGNYEGVATGAEFLVAKINRAPESLQRIYGGVPSSVGALMPDIVMGLSKLVDFAQQQNKPAVFYMPFNSNISTHDGTFSLEQFIRIIAAKPSITIVIPTGEEADKMHHETILAGQEGVTTINIRVERENQNILGILCQKVTTIFTTTLSRASNSGAGVVNLRREGITILGEKTTVYSNGEYSNFSNGVVQTLFRIDNPEIGDWQLNITMNPDLENIIDLWIGQQELNEFSTLSPFNPFITLGSNACIYGISVGAYDRDTTVVLRSSGRGYNWDFQILPRYVTHANNIIAPYTQGQWVSITGTLVAASVIAGVAAAIYSKCIAEEVFPLPNTLVMDSIIFKVIKELEGVEYPNRNQGGGIFDINSLGTLLVEPLTGIRSL